MRDVFLIIVTPLIKPQLTTPNELQWFSIPGYRAICICRNLRHIRHIAERRENRAFHSR